MWRTLLTLIVLVAVGSLAAEPTPGIPSKAGHSRAKELISKLGDKSFRIREAATRELLKIGIDAKDAIDDGRNSADAEISERCKKLLPEIYRQDLEQRLQQFVDSPADAPSLNGLPMVKPWLKLVGNSVESRKLYAEAVRIYSDRFIACEVNPYDMSGNYLSYCREVGGRHSSTPGSSSAARPPAGEPEVLTFLFLGSAGPPRSIVQTISISNYYSFLNSNALGNSLKDSKPDSPYRKLFLSWIANERSISVLRRGLDIATTNGITECAPIALRTASDKNATVFVRASCLLFYGRLANGEELKELDPFLKDDLIISANVLVNGDRWSVQMRDVALGAAILAAKQQPKDFGFERQTSDTGFALNSYINFAFANDEKRAAAFSKWQDWKAAQSKTPKSGN